MGILSGNNQFPSGKAYRDQYNSALDQRESSLQKTLSRAGSQKKQEGQLNQFIQDKVRAQYVPNLEGTQVTNNKKLSTSGANKWVDEFIQGKGQLHDSVVGKNKDTFADIEKNAKKAFGLGDWKKAAQSVLLGSDKSFKQNRARYAGDVEQSRINPRYKRR